MRLAPTEVRIEGNEETLRLQTRVRRTLPRRIASQARSRPSVKVAGYVAGLGPTGDVHVRHRLWRLERMGQIANVQRRRVLGGRSG